MRVEWTGPALDDMADIRDYIAEDSKENAYRFIERLFAGAPGCNNKPTISRFDVSAIDPMGLSSLDTRALGSQ
jgi:plasmid stabilization system protein ParE